MNTTFNSSCRTQHTNELFHVLLYANKNNKVTLNELLSKEAFKLTENDVNNIIKNVKFVLNDLSTTSKYLDVVMTSAIFTNILLEFDKLSKEDKKWYFALNKNAIVEAYKNVINSEENPYYYSKVIEILIISIKYFNNVVARNEIYVLLRKQLNRLIEDYNNKKVSIHTIINLFSLLKENKYNMEYFEDEQNTFIASINYKDLLNITVEKFKQTMTITPSEYALLFNKYKKLIQEYPYNELHIYSFMMCLKYAKMTSTERKNLSDYYDEKYKNILSKEAIKVSPKPQTTNFEYVVDNAVRNAYTKVSNANIPKKRQDKLAKAMFSVLNTEYINLLYQNIKESYSQQIHTDDKKYVYYAEPKNMIKKFDVIDSYQIALIQDFVVKFAELIFEVNLLTDEDVSVLFNANSLDNSIISNTLMFEIINLYEKQNWELFIPLMSTCLSEIYKIKKQNNSLPNNIPINAKLKEQILYFSNEDKQRFFKQNSFINCLNKAITEYLSTAENNSTTATVLILYFMLLWYI